MKLPNSMTTVTPLSKAIAMALFVALPFVGFYLGMKYQSSISTNPIETVKNAPFQQQEVTPQEPTNTPAQINGCKSSADCPAGASCQNGVCIGVDNIEKSCITDTDCPGHTAIACSDGQAGQTFCHVERCIQGVCQYITIPEEELNNQ